MSVPAEVAKRAAALRDELREHGRRYYVLDDPIIGDDEYDKLLDELRGIEALGNFDLEALLRPAAEEV